jgi:hypothetical protein
VAPRDLVPVGDVAERREAIGANLAELARRGPDERVEAHTQQDEQQRGEQPAGAASPEPRQGDRPVARVLLEEERRDEEPGEDEEQVDPEPPAGQVAGVEQQHRRDRRTSHAVERRKVRAGAAGRRPPDR